MSLLIAGGESLLRQRVLYQTGLQLTGLAAIEKVAEAQHSARHSRS